MAKDDLAKTDLRRVVADMLDAAKFEADAIFRPGGAYCRVSIDLPLLIAGADEDA